MTKNDVSTSPSSQAIDSLDERLISETLQGHESSFGQLMQKHHSFIFLMVHRHLRQREEAEDVCQQVFLRAYQHLKNFRGESKFSTWLYTIALNLVRNHVRQRKIRRMDSLDITPKSEDVPIRQWADQSPLPEEIVHHRWELDRVLVALATLPDPHRSIFTLHYLQHFSLKEISIRLHRPIGTVKVYLHRSRKLILAQLENKSQNKFVTT